MSYKDQERPNRGTLCLADENGSRELFDGQQFVDFVVQNGILLATKYQDESGLTSTLHYASLQDLVLHSVNTPAASSMRFLGVDENTIFWRSEQYDQQTYSSKDTLYCQNLASGTQTSWELPEVQIEYVSYGYYNGTLYFFYQTGNEVWGVNTQTQTDFLLDNFSQELPMIPLTIENGWFIEHMGSEFSSTRLRICSQFAQTLP